MMTQNDAFTGAAQAIDCHSHYIPESYSRLLRRHAAADSRFVELYDLFISAGPENPVRRVDGRLADMDESGVAVSLLSLPPPGITFLPENEAMTAAAEANQEMIEIARQSAGRLAVLAAVPLPFLDAAIDELERVASAPEVRGIGLFSVAETWTVDDPRIRRFFVRAADLGLPVTLHPAIEPLPAAYGAWGLDGAFGTVFSSSLAAARMVLSGMLDEIPDLTVVIPHLGGTLPYLLQRITDQANSGSNEHDFSHYCKTRFYFDTCSYHPPALTCAIETAGVDRIILGSDYPYRGAVGRAVRDVESASLDESGRAKILGGNARVLYFGVKGMHDGF